MASELFIRYTCDRCGRVAVEGDDEFHAELPVRVGELDRVVDLCTECYAETVAAFIEEFAELGVDAGTAQRPAAASSTAASTGRPVGHPRGRGAHSPESQRALLERHPDALACPVCLALFTPGGAGQTRRKYLGSHMSKQHGQSPADYTDRQLAEADAVARAQLKTKPR